MPRSVSITSYDHAPATLSVTEAQGRGGRVTRALKNNPYPIQSCTSTGQADVD